MSWRFYNSSGQQLMLLTPGGLDDLSDVTITGLAQGDILAHNGSAVVDINIAEQRMVGRLTGEDVKGMTAAEVRTFANVEDGADVTDATNVNAAGAVMEADFDANTILAADSDDTPGALTVGEDTIVGRSSGGNIDDLSPTDARAILNVEDAADVTDATNVAAAGAVMDSDISEAEGFLRKTGAGAYEAIKSNLSASSAPGATDDSGEGYAVGSKWIDTTADKAYVCLDATEDAAVWTETTQSGGGGGTLAVEEAGASVVAAADTLDFKDFNVEDDGGGQAGIYLDIRHICQGRLTLTTGTPVTTSDVAAATTLYFAPYKGNQIGLYDGTRWKLYAFTERSISIPATTDTNYDVYLYDNSGTLTLELVAWTNDTTRATALATQDGIYVKTGATTRRYLGTVRTTDTSGECEDSTSRRFVWNYYNQINRPLLAKDSTASWTYSVNTWRAANNATAFGVARVGVVVGVAEAPILMRYSMFVYTTGVPWVAAGIGIDSTAVNSAPVWGTAGAAGVYTTLPIPVINQALSAGYHYVQALEKVQAVGTTTWHGIGSAGGAVETGMTGHIRG